MHRKALVVVMVASLLAGCAGGPSDASDGDGEEQDGGPERTAALDVDDASGVVPHEPVFSIDASPASDVASWRLDFGEGNASEGTSVPADATRNYSESGRYVATLTVTFEDGTERSDQAVVLVQPPPPPPPIQRSWNASALVGLPHPGRLDDAPYPSEGPSHAEIALQAYENGGNGTTVVGFEVEVSERHRAVAAFLRMPIVQPPSGPPVTTDYDLFLFAPNGSLADASQTNSTVETVRTTDVTGGDWLLLVAHWAGADAPDPVSDDPVPPARALFVAA